MLPGRPRPLDRVVARVGQLHEGGLIGYASDPAAQYRRADGYVDQIFKGAKPAALPVEQLTKFELVINMKTAKAFGLTIPQSVLGRTRSSSNACLTNADGSLALFEVSMELKEVSMEHKKEGFEAH